jgi:gliding motility-associated-like protein
MTIIVKDEKNIFVPNVITPNGDGVNDLWNIADLTEVFSDNEVVIVNRWGDEVFRQKGYGTSQAKKWDGTYKGEKLPDGTYYYIIKLNNIEKSVTGPVTIISE